MKRPLLLGLLLTLSSSLQAANAGSLLAFATDDRLTLAIGKFEPGHGWVESTDFYAPPQPGDVFTIYTPEGIAATATIQEKRSPYENGTFASWSAQVSKWENRSTPFALAVAGTAPLVAVPLEPIPLDSPKYCAIVSRYLKSHGLRVDQPFLTQAFKIPQKDSDQEEAVLVAHSDASAVSTADAVSIYALALLWRSTHGKEKILPLASQTSFKPAGRTREEHEHLYGPRDFLRLIAAVDIIGDGGKELVLYDAKEDATQIDVFSFNGRRLKRVLSTYKPNYN